ncbi:MAG: serine/threonine-protein kinase [Planctomycetota bacterium]|jgi:predicted Ser/Thr protein kinase
MGTEPDRLLGERAEERDWVTPEDLARAVEVQELAARDGLQFRLGEVLTRLGLLTLDQVRELLREQDVEIAFCSTCLGMYNVKPGEEVASAKCPNCGASLSVPDTLHSIDVAGTVLVSKGGPSEPPGEKAAARIPADGVATMPGTPATASEQDAVPTIVSNGPLVPSPAVSKPSSPGKIRRKEEDRRLGKYRVLEEIGRGGMGIVYKAFDPDLKRTVALKVIISGEDASKEAIERFRREAEAVAKLGHHPNIVPVHEVGAEKNRHFIAMHFVEGKSLDDMITDGEVAPRRAAKIARKIASALAHAHAKGVLHRDVKPANILVTSSGEPQITDFGLARDVESDSALTQSGTTMGSPSYMPPEQADGRLEAIDARSDVYSLGAALYEMLVGRPPFEGATMINVIRKVIMEEPASPRQWNPSVPRDLETICLKCLEKDPERRYASAEVLGEDLRRFLESEPSTGCRSA